jgi:hypothetical protein
MKEFTLIMKPATSWKVRVVVWPTRAAMIREHHKYCNDDCEAFFVSRDDLKVVGEIHFYRGNRSTRVIIHEATHAVVALALKSRLDLSGELGDEIFAQTLEYLVPEIKKQVVRKQKTR